MATSCREEIHMLDIGTVFRATVLDSCNPRTAADISAATTTELRFTAPDGTVADQTAAFTTDGTDGQIQYATLANDLDQEGNWQLQGHVITPGGEWRTSIHRFRVYANL